MLKYVVGTLCTLTLAGTVYMAGWGPQPAHAGIVSASDEPAVCTHCEAEAKWQAEQDMLLMEVSAPLVAQETPATKPGGTTPPATGPAVKAVDAGNTKCLVSGDDIGGMGGAKNVEYKGKVYHFCCDDCVPVFKKDPEKYIKILEADPAKFGVKK